MDISKSTTLDTGGHKQGQLLEWNSFMGVITIAETAE